MIVGLMGYARSGKDTTARVLIEEHGFVRVAFADALRDMAYAMNPLVDDRHPFVPQRLQHIVDMIGWDEAKQRYTEVRRLLQTLGTEAGRTVLGDSIWVDTAMRKVTAGDYVFTDVRFPNEAEAIRDAAGELWRVAREGTGPVNGHPSETALDGWPYDALIINDGTIADLSGEVKYALNPDA